MAINVNMVDQIDRSVKAGVPAYNWIPPEWIEGQTSPPKLEDNIEKADSDAIEPRLKPNRPDPKTCRERVVEKHPGEETPKPPSVPIREFKHGFDKWVHPDSDFTHVDPPEFDDDDMDIARQALHGNAPQLEKLKRLVGREPFGMQRLAVVFEWALCKATDLLSKINEGLGVGESGGPANRQTYETVRNAYVQFLRDLDDHEPQLRKARDPKDPTKPEPVVPGQAGKSGYGKSLKWIYVHPIISEGRIKGAKVAIHWNPHSSSNGIPIPHS